MYDLIHCGDSGSWCYTMGKKGASEAMVNRILQKGYEQGMAPMGRMTEIGGCGFQAYHWYVALRDFMVARRSGQEFDQSTRSYLYPRSM
eukprot:8354956-Alexandrium_andersonii.AAC.1